MTSMKALVKSHLSAGVRDAFRDLRMELYLQRRHREGIRAAARKAERGPLRLNLGSGFRPRPGWINVDLSDQADLALDLRQPLPFGDNTAESIYSEHFFEHLEYASPGESTGWDFDPERSEARAFLAECRRVLMPGGQLDIVVPDAEGIVGEYARRHEQPFPAHPWWGPKWCDTPLHCVNYVFRQGREHRYAYDEETLSSVLTQAGFCDVHRRPFDPAVDAPNHEIGSLCMIARRPPKETHHG